MTEQKYDKGANREKSEPAFISTVSRETWRLDNQQARNLPKNKQRNYCDHENPPSNLSVQAPDLSELKTQVMAELKLKLEKKYSQAQGPPRDMSHDSDSLTYRASPTPAQDVSTADAGVPQVLHVHSKDSADGEAAGTLASKASIKVLPGSEFPTSCKERYHAPSPKPTGSKSVELGGGDARVRISQPGGKRFPSQDTVLEDMRGSKSPQTLSQKGQVPPPLPTSSLVGKADSHFLSKMKSFFQRLQPGIKWKMPESPQEKGIPLSSAQSRGPVKSTAAFTGTAHVMSNIGKFSKEKLGLWETCAEGTVQAQAEPGQARPFHRRTPSYEVTNAMSGRHAAVLAGQGSTCSRHTRNEDKHPQNVVTLKPQQICQKHPQSVPLRGLCPIQAPPAGLKLPRGLLLFSPLLEAQPSEISSTI
ncbi:LOW QUALITY PROTEIN: hypothetical protein QTO34_005562 [Cnephaeus nilssonii]|uniref:Uncharacterized protein n=1 Tax=Cnephaeus nilssonii TaxID=3371016 RepID=A0AA40HNK7_CNENI|nr:LOW QUALITY PROTEIN: hypothetical protein QTO34_005562 [Eptesicus nilssonii]